MELKEPLVEYCHNVDTGCTMATRLIDTQLLIGFAFCNLKKDRYSKKIARNIASARLGHEFKITQDEWVTHRKRFREEFYFLSNSCWISSKTRIPQEMIACLTLLVSQTSITAR